ncbi:hypothetical protein KI809_15560 [Geobacter pelophilus]|uniref:Toxin-antitoxin system HicB family antitoxin n=1 Tax=Geoanaerobacter pelophilus TaxID=60036 RepID=A0AAW4L847_9BACT|nr:hypothetical protein [Geoanaerobacter pelophilus]MBT0664750.1 hypothetical protein [Geoanaerobacter pelophilus]MBT0665726.1 hypothetical protein [Geoanaerobacter pelophilus]
MPKMKEHPRYNIISTRIDDHLHADVVAAAGDNLSNYLRLALEEKIIRDQQRALDAHLADC